MDRCEFVWQYDRLLEGLQSFFHVKSRSCFRLRNSMSDWFPVKAHLYHEYMMSPWLFDICMVQAVLST